ncbi:ATP-binding protein [Candidatus Bathyarchaeota archaeon]|nr:ATP-binding protein [Candidatus Bathyarchaeota archaeon]
MVRDDSELLRLLHIHNPWWTTGQVPGSLAPAFRRRDLFKLVESVETREIIGVVGARRVGKTTLMYQLIQRLLETVDATRILFLKIDDPYLGMDKDEIRRVFDVYALNVLKEPLESLSERIYVLLDEVQSLPGWELYLKRWFDFGYGIKFIVSGSASTEIMRDGSDSLVGRFRPQIVVPMKFLEVLRYRSHGVDEDRYDLVNWRLRDAMREGVVAGDFDLMFASFHEVSRQLIGERDQILIHLNDYMLRGGYPEVVTQGDVHRSADILRNYLSLTIYRDIVKTFRIRDPGAFESLFTVLASGCCHRLNYSELSSELGVKRDTLRDYLYYMEHSYLVTESRFYTRNVRKQARKEKKIYINDNGLRNSVLGLLGSSRALDSAQLGVIVENLVANHCRGLKYNLEPTLESGLHYWYDDGGHEVDVVLSLFGKSLPIEIKYREVVSGADIRGLNSFLGEHRGSVGFVVTKNLLRRDADILYVPLWLFLIMC